MRTMGLRNCLIVLCAAAFALPAAAGAQAPVTPHDLMLLNRVT